MAGHGARRGNLVYHWKHGWIPLDHFAALSKAHHSKGGAVKVMQKHGIEVPKGYRSDHKPSAPNVKDTHPLGATVRASQPGIDNQIHGRIVGHAPNGMVQVAHTGHGGKPLVGVFNPSHTHVIAAGATTPHVTPHTEPHTLKPGEHATVRGIDHMGQPTTFTGKVTSNGEVSSFAKGRTTGGRPLRSISIERQDGSKRQNVVYVPDPNRGETKRGSAAERAAAPAKVRSLPAGDTFKGVHSETHMGEKITVRRGKQWGTLQTEINGQHAGTPYGLRNSDAVKELDSLKATIEHAKANPGSYTNGAGEHSYGMKLTPKPADVHATRAADLRAAAAKKRAEADRIANGVGAPDRAGAMLRAKDSQRMNARMDSGLRRFTEKQREAKALESKAHLAEGRAKSATEKQAASDLALTASKVSPGDLIAHKGQAHMVTKVNRTTVSVPSIVGGTWEDKLPLGQVSKHVKVADMKESTLRTLMSRAKGNAALQAVYMAELKRRGLL